MTLPAPVTIEVFGESEVGSVQRATQKLALAVGFPPTAVEEISIAASELASNLIRHAHGQRLLTLSPLREGTRTGLRLESLDQGPGIADVNLVLRDGFSTAAGTDMGLGLGSINRLMDELHLESKLGPHAHTRVIAQRWVQLPFEAGKSCQLQTGAYTRPKAGQTFNGDAWIIEHQNNGALLVGVIDGLGHGQLAQRAALSASQYVRSHADRPLVEIFHGTHIACQGTRGVVMALARFEPAAGQMQFASIGNIEARILGPTHTDLRVRRGVLGAQAPTAVVSQCPWQPGWILVLHSDGVSTHWSHEEALPCLRTSSAQAMAHALLEHFTRENDDATVLVVCNKVAGATA